MTDGISQIYRDQQETTRLLKEGKIIKCLICWNSIKNDRKAYIEHCMNHTISQIVDGFTELSFDLWKNTYKAAFERLYKVNEK